MSSTKRSKRDHKRRIPKTRVKRTYIPQEPELPINSMLTENEVQVVEHAGIKILSKMTKTRMTNIKDRPIRSIPAPPGIPDKYWSQRYKYFSRYDEGI